MYSQLLLKEKNTEVVVYRYGMDSKDAPIDGEIEYDVRTKKSKLLKSATGDSDDGFHARLVVFSRLHHIVANEGCPVKRFIAIG